MQRLRITEMFTICQMLEKSKFMTNHAAKRQINVTLVNHTFVQQANHELTSVYTCILRERARY